MQVLCLYGVRKFKPRLKSVFRKRQVTVTLWLQSFSTRKSSLSHATIYVYCTVFALFYFKFKDNFRVQAPGGLYLEGRFTGRFFALRVWGLIFSEHYGIWKKLNPLPPNKMVRFGLRAASSLISEGWEICSSTLFCPRLRISQAVTSLKITTLAQSAQSVII